MALRLMILQMPETALSNTKINLLVSESPSICSSAAIRMTNPALSGDRKYPHIYYFDRPDCGSELWGFPLIWTVPYEGGDPGLVRSIFTFVNEGGNIVAR